MGVYIPFAKKLPCDCNACFVAISGCKVKNPYINGRPSDCPLVEVKPHGRLIDADALKESLHDEFDDDEVHAFEKGAYWNHNVVVDIITNAPTIIEAEEDKT